MNQIIAPSPNTLQQTGAFISQGGTTLAEGNYSLLTQLADLTPLLSASLALSNLSWSGGTATATTASTTIAATGSSYNSGTGVVTLNLTAGIGLAVGSSVVVASVTGTGADLADVNGTFTATVGTSGTTLEYVIATSLTISTITGGTVTIGHGVTVSDTFLTAIAGATPAVYNGTVLATAATATTFTYALASDGGTSPATGSITYTPRNVAELVAMATTFFAQGAATAVYVLELGAGEPAAGVTNLQTFITASPQFFYAYLMPRSWDGVSSFLTFLGGYESNTAKTYFYVTTTTGTYTDYADLMKCVFWQIEAPTVATTEFDLAADFYTLLHYAPSSTNKVTPFEYTFVFDCTAYPTKNNAALLAEISAANGNYIGSGAEGGISDLIIFGGTYADGNPVNYWYSIDWAQITVNLFVSNAVINGSNDPTNPLYYNQAGINRLQAVAASVMGNGITYGLVLNPVIQTELDAAAFVAALDAGTYDNFTVINAIPFVNYVAENPSDYKIGKYAGFTIAYTPLRGFDRIIFNLDASNFA